MITTNNMIATADHMSTINHMTLVMIMMTNHMTFTQLQSYSGWPNNIDSIFM